MHTIHARRNHKWLLIGLLLLAGCSAPVPTEPADELDVAEPDEVTLDVIDEAGLAEAIQLHRGKVVLVDYWATWCEPCKRLFPHTVKLHQQYADQGLVVFSVSLDDPEEEATITKFLTDQRATFPNFVSQYGAGSKSMEKFAIDNGAVPHFKLFGPDGQLHRAFASGEEPIDPHQIDRSVKELLDL